MPDAMSNDMMRTDELIPPTNDIPDGLNAIYRKLMAKEPNDRFASADQLAEALAPFTRKRSPHAPREKSRTTSESPNRSDSDAVQAPSNGSLAPAIVTQNITATGSEALMMSGNPQRTPPRRPNRKWLFAAGGAAAALVMLGVIIITITNKDGTKSRIEVPGDSKVEITNSSAPQPSTINLPPGTVGLPMHRHPPSRRSTPSKPSNIRKPGPSISRSTSSTPTRLG